MRDKNKDNNNDFTMIKLPDGKIVNRKAKNLEGIAKDEFENKKKCDTIPPIH